MFGPDHSLLTRVWLYQDKTNAIMCCSWDKPSLSSAMLVLDLTGRSMASLGGKQCCLKHSRRHLFRRQIVASGLGFSQTCTREAADRGVRGDVVWYFTVCHVKYVHHWICFSTGCLVKCQLEICDVPFLVHSMLQTRIPRWLWHALLTNLLFSNSLRCLSFYSSLPDNLLSEFLSESLTVKHQVYFSTDLSASHNWGRQAVHRIIWHLQKDF